MIKSAFISDKGGRAYNEDSARECMCGDAYCAVLADGLGGHGGSDLASAAACRAICENWDGEISAAKVSKLLLDAHEAIHELQSGGGQMKSTGVVLLASAEKVAWGHVGDSRLYWFDDGELVLQTKDHSASQIAVCMGQITQDEIRFHRDRSRLMKALGQDGSVLPETDETNLFPAKHCFLLCSDGFWEYVLEGEMASALAVSNSPNEWLALMEVVVSNRVKGNNDNYTAAAVWL